jgi:hypothetical protein
MPHVFLETNWVFSYAAPAHLGLPAAVEILERAERGEFTLHLPAICFSEARRPLLEKHQVRREADRVRQYLLWARDQNLLEPANEAIVRTVMDQMESRVRNDLNQIDEKFERVRQSSAVEVFNLDQPMLESCANLSFRHLD